MIMYMTNTGLSNGNVQGQHGINLRTAMTMYKANTGLNEEQL